MAPSSLLSAVVQQYTSSDGSLIPLAPPWSVVNHPAPWDYTSLRPCQAPSSPRLLLSPLSLWLHHGLPYPLLRVGRRHHVLRLGPPDPPRYPCSLALRLSLRLLLHLLCHCWSVIPPPWLLPPSSPPSTLSARSFLVLLLQHGTRVLGGGVGVMSHPWTVHVLFLIPRVDLSCVLDCIKVYLVYPWLHLPSSSDWDNMLPQAKKHN